MPAKATSTQNPDNSKVSGSVVDVADFPDYGAGTTTYRISVVHRKGGPKFHVETEAEDIQSKIKKGDRVVMDCHPAAGDEWHVQMVLDDFDVIKEGPMDLTASGEVTGTRGDREYATSELSDMLVTRADGTEVPIKVYEEFYEDLDNIEVGKKVKVTYRQHTHTYEGAEYTRLIMTGVEEVA